MVAPTRTPPFHNIVLPALVPVKVELKTVQLRLLLLNAVRVGLSNGGVNKINPAPHPSLSTTKATTCGPG